MTHFHNLSVLAAGGAIGTLLRQLAVENDCVETIMLRDGCMTEGAASNIFLVKNGVILTPPKDTRILPGITYDVVLELAARHGMAHEIRDVTEAELRTADELWMTSSTKEVLAITTLDGKPVGDGKPGPLTRQLQRVFREIVERETGQRAATRNRRPES